MRHQNDMAEEGQSAFVISLVIFALLVAAAVLVAAVVVITMLVCANNPDAGERAYDRLDRAHPPPAENLFSM